MMVMLESAGKGNTALLANNIINETSFKSLSQIIDSAESMAIRMNVQGKLHGLYKAAFFALEGNNEHLEASRYVPKYMRAVDSVFSQQNREAKAKFDAEYDVHQAKLKNEKLNAEAERKTLYTTFGGLAAALIIGVLTVLWIFSQKRNKTLAIKNKVIEEQANQLKELDNFKSDFFANVSHELRTPLTSDLI